MAGQSIRFLAVGWFGAAMGLAGLAIALRNASKVLAVPAALGEIVEFAAIVLESALVAAYVLKYARHRDAVRAEFTNPASMGFTGTLPVSLMLVAGCLAPCCEAIAVPVWWLGAGILVVVQLYALARLFGGGIDAAQINAGWLIMVLGGLAAPIGGLPLGLLEASRVLFGISLAASPLVMGLVFWRAIVGPVMPDAMRPSLFIFIVPPSLAYVLYPVLSGETPYWVAACFHFSVVLAIALLIASRRLFGWPFGAPWAAFTFPLDALATAAIRHASVNPSPIASGIAWIALALAGFFVALVLGRALGALVRTRAERAPAG